VTLTVADVAWDLKR